jgi:biofilm PGA synthesis N-glycosyltransferase PgaC
MNPLGAYVLMTPARNEASNIPRVLDTVAAQTQRPLRWVIIDDGSNDRTAEIVDDFARKHDFVQLLRQEPTGERTFASKAQALKKAYEALRSIPFDFVGNLDADIELPPDYYAGILEKFREDPQLGLAGGIIWDVVGDRMIKHITNINSVAGAVQLFRRACYDAIGGYFPSRVGGIDTIAEVSARMRGWKVSSLPEVRVLHHRETGTALHGNLKAAWRAGLKDYRLGYHPAFYVLMCVRRVWERPRLLGSLLRCAAYGGQALRRIPLEAPPDVAAFMKEEQRSRLKRALHPRTWIQSRRLRPTGPLGK